MRKTIFALLALLPLSAFAIDVKVCDGGECATVTDGKLDINGTFSAEPPVGAALDATLTSGAQKTQLCNAAGTTCFSIDGAGKIHVITDPTSVTALQVGGVAVAGSNPLPVAFAPAYPNAAVSPSLVTTGVASARTDADFPANSLVRFMCTADTYVELGGGTVEATTSSKLILVGGLPEYHKVKTETRAAFILAAGSGKCSVVVITD